MSTVKNRSKLRIPASTRAPCGLISRTWWSRVLFPLNSSVASWCDAERTRHWQRVACTYTRTPYKVLTITGGGRRGGGGRRQWQWRPVTGRQWWVVVAWVVAGEYDTSDECKRKRRREKREMHVEKAKNWKAMRDVVCASHSHLRFLEQRVRGN